MWVDPENDPNLENVRDKLTNLRTLIDEADWNGEDVTNAQRQMANVPTPKRQTERRYHARTFAITAANRP